MVKRSGNRALALAASAALVLGSIIAGAAPVFGHGNTCASGNSDYVAIMFVDGGQTGTADDICWINTHSFDDQFSVNEVNVDDIGEQTNYHDAVSSMAVKNNGTDGFCVRYYQDANQSVLRETQWVGDGEGDIHFTAAYNDNYDSLDLLRVSQNTCFN